MPRPGLGNSERRTRAASQPCWQYACPSANCPVLHTPVRWTDLPERGGNNGHRAVARRRENWLRTGKRQLVGAPETSLQEVGPVRVSADRCSGSHKARYDVNFAESLK